MNATDFLTSIRAGDLDACLILADWLEEEPRLDHARSRRLRQRYRRWQKERARADGLVNSMARKVVADQDALLASYLERLLAETSEVTADRVPLWVRVSQPGGPTDHVPTWKDGADNGLLCGGGRGGVPAGTHWHEVGWTVSATDVKRFGHNRRCRRCVLLLPTVRLADLPRPSNTPLVDVCGPEAPT